jgi:aminoglycoside/choline kinase family phosphotransferase
MHNKKINISEKLPKIFEIYNIVVLEGGASKKKFYRLENKNKTLVLISFIDEKIDYKKHLYVYNLLRNINISIPKIIYQDPKNFFIITEDYGNLRFDKILKDYPIKDLLSYAVDTLIMVKKSFIYRNNINLIKYNYDIFKKEIYELPKYYFPYINLKDKIIEEEFKNIWKEAYQNINFDFTSFVHKDFNINNLILILSKDKYLKCGVIDYQNAFYGDDTWDLFSLLEDSRILFDESFNNYFIEKFYTNTNQKISLEYFKKKYYFLSSSRQTRLLGRWVKLSRELNQKNYIDYISVTKKRLNKSINLLNNKNLTNFYNKYILN